MLSRLSKKLKRSKLRKTKDEEPEKEVEVLPGFRNLFSEELPRFPEALIKYLEENGGANVEGIFRIPGSQQDMQTMHKLYLSAGDEVVFDFAGYSIHTIAGALKLWVRKMPVPLMTFELYETWMNATEIAEEDLKLSAIIKVTNSLPPAHKSFLKRILQFLVKIAENAEETKMSSVNLAIVFSPTFLRGLDESNAMKLLNDQIKGNGLIQILIDKYNEIFGLKRRNAPKLRRDKTVEEKNFIKSLQKGSVVLAKALIIEHHRSLELQNENKENNVENEPNEEIKKDTAEEEQIKKEAAQRTLLFSIPKIDPSNNNNEEEDESQSGWTTSRKRNCLTRSMPIAPHRKELKDKSHRQLLKKLSQSNFSDLLEIKNDLPPSLSSQITKLSSSRLLDYFDNPPKPPPKPSPKPFSTPSPLSSPSISVDNLSIVEEYPNDNSNDDNNINNNIKDNNDIVDDIVDEKEEINHENGTNDDNVDYNDYDDVDDDDVVVEDNNKNDNDDNDDDNVDYNDYDDVDDNDVEDNNEIDQEGNGEENKKEVPVRKIMQLNVTTDSENEELIEELSLNEHENIVLGIITGHIGAVGEFLQTINDEEANTFVANLESKYASYFADFDEFSQSVIESDSPRSTQINDYLA